MTSTKEKIVSFMGVLQDPVYTRAEFAKFGSKGQVSRALTELIREKCLVRVGVGLYSPSRVSSMNGNAIPVDNMMKIGLTAFKKLGIEVEMGTRYKDLYSGKSTQVPMIPILNVGASKTTRKIGHGPTMIHYERVASRKPKSD